MGDAKAKLRNELRENAELAPKTAAQTRGYERERNSGEKSLRGGEKAGKGVKDSSERVKMQPGVVLKFSCEDKITNNQIQVCLLL